MRFHWGRGYRDHHDRRNLMEVVCYLVTFGILYISILWFGTHSLAHTYLEQIVCKMGFSRYQQESYFRFISSHQDDWQKTPMVIWFDTFTHFCSPLHFTQKWICLLGLVLFQTSMTFFQVQCPSCFCPYSEWCSCSEKGGPEKKSSIWLIHYAQYFCLTLNTWPIVTDVKLSSLLLFCFELWQPLPNSAKFCVPLKKIIWVWIDMTKFLFLIEVFQKIIMKPSKSPVLRR